MGIDFNEKQIRCLLKMEAAIGAAQKLAEHWTTELGDFNHTVVTPRDRQKAFALHQAIRELKEARRTISAP